MAQAAKPSVVWHADWGSKEKKRWRARATLGTDGLYTAFAPKPVGNLGSLIGQLRTEARETGCAFAGFDFPIGLPAFYAKRAGIASFRAQHIRGVPSATRKLLSELLARTATSPIVYECAVAARPELRIALRIR